MLCPAVKVKECSFRKDSRKWSVSLIKLLDKDVNRVKFALHLKEVPRRGKGEAKNGTRTARLFYLVEKEEGKIIEQYFSAKGSVGEHFPDLGNSRWRANQSWLDAVARASVGERVLVNKPVSASRSSNKLGGFNRHLNLRVLQLANSLM